MCYLDLIEQPTETLQGSGFVRIDNCKTLGNYYLQDAFQGLYILSQLRRQSQCYLIFTNEETEAKKKM